MKAATYILQDDILNSEVIYGLWNSGQRFVVNAAPSNVDAQKQLIIDAGGTIVKHLHIEQSREISDQCAAFLRGEKMFD